MNNIITAVFTSGNSYTRLSGAWQYDYGQVLRLQGLQLPPAVEVHFSLTETGGESVTRIGVTQDGVTDVPVPDSLLENGNASHDYTIYVFLYLADGSAGNTEYKISLQVRSRPRPEVPGAPEEPGLFREAIEAVNKVAERAETAAGEAASSAVSADKSATEASGAATAAVKTEERIKQLEEDIKKVGQDAEDAVKQQETASKQAVTAHTDTEITLMQKAATEAESDLGESIRDAGTVKTQLDGSVEDAGSVQKALDNSISDAGDSKTALDKSIGDAGMAKTQLDKSIEGAGTGKTALDKSIGDARTLKTELDDDITAGSQLKTDLKTAGDTAVKAIRDEAETQLDKVQHASDDIIADREQIGQNKTDIEQLNANKADKTALADTNKELANARREIRVLNKVSQGVLWEFEVDSQNAYTRQVPTGAYAAAVESIGGQTVAWNQYGQLSNLIRTNKCNAVKSEESEFGRKVTFTVTEAGTGLNWNGVDSGMPYVPDHYIYVSAIVDVPKATRYGFYSIGDKSEKDLSVGKNKLSVVEKFKTLPESQGKFFALLLKMDSAGYEVGDVATIEDWVFVDLTRLFGTGNEPVDALDPRIAWIDYYVNKYSGYNVGELVSASVREIDFLGSNLLDEDELIQGMYLLNVGAVPTISPDEVNRFVSTNFIPISREANEIVIKSEKANGRYTNWMGFLDYKKRVISAGAWKYNTPISKPFGTRYVLFRFSIAKNTGDLSPGDIANADFQINVGTIATDYSPYKSENLLIPEKVQSLPGYGWSAGDAQNTVERTEDGWQYVQRVGSVDLGKLTYRYRGDIAKGLFSTEEMKDYKYYNAAKTLCGRYGFGTTVNGVDNTETDKSTYLYYNNNVPDSRLLYIKDSSFTDAAVLKKALSGEQLYYELATPIVTDISDIMATEALIFETEQTGSITMKNGAELYVPADIQYTVKLSEVVK